MIRRGSRFLIAGTLLGVSAFFTLRAEDTLRVASRRVASPPGPAYVEGEVVVQFREGADDRIAERAIREGGAARARRSERGQRYLVGLDAGFSVAEAVAR